MPLDAVFDARTVAPAQMGGKHPVGNKFPFSITNTEIKKVKDKEAGLFAVQLTSPAGSITFNYNLWNESPQAREIAGKQLSALCHATGIMQVDFKNDGKSLIGGRGLMDVGFQSGQEPSAERPEGGYVEIKKIYDVNGNEPGVANAAPSSGGFGGQQQQPQGGAAPAVQNGFGQPQPNPNPQQQQPQQGGWGTQQQPNPQQQQPQQQQPPAGNQGGWQQNGTASAPANAPWGAR